MGKIRSIVVGVLMLMVAVLGGYGSLSVSANVGGLYTVDPILPDNQDEGVRGYVSVTADGDTFKQTFDYVVTNKVDKELEFKVNKLNALTSPNGSIQYIEETDTTNSKLLDENYSMAKYMEISEDTFTLKPGESKQISATVDISGVTGTILGGVGVKGFEEGEFEEKEGGNFKINNEVNTVIGMVVEFGESDADEFIFGDPYVDMMPAYYAIRLPITYNTNNYKKGTRIHYTVYDKVGTELFKVEDVGRPHDFAPKTLANVPFPWQAEGIEKGQKYKVKGTLTYLDSKSTDGSETVLEFDKDFIFTGEQDGQGGGGINVPELVKKYWYWILLLALAVGGALVYVGLRGTKREYVLYTNDAEAEAEFTSRSTEGSQVQELKGATNPKGYKYGHIYEKHTEEGKDSKYVHVRTENANTHK